MRANSYKSESICQAVLLLDVNNFKAKNNTYCNHTDDKILLKISNIIEEVFKKQNYYIYRTCNELAIIAEDISEAEITDLMNKIQNTVDLGTSMGYAISNKKESFKEIFAKAYKMLCDNKTKKE